jgi:hypothetical protein
MKQFSFLALVTLTISLTATSAVTAGPMLFHTFIVRDQQGNPIQDAVVKPLHIFGTSVNSDPRNRPSCITDKNGQCQITLRSKFDGTSAYSHIEAQVTKVGYIPSDFVVDRQGDKPRDDGLRVILQPTQQSFLAKFKTIDLAGRPLAGVRIVGKLPRYGVDFECSTDSTGMCEQNVKYEAADRIALTMNVEASTVGRYVQKSTQAPQFGQAAIDYSFILDQPVDYLCSTMKVPASGALVKQMTAWVDHLRLRALIQDTVVSHGDFCTSSFKNKKYASVKLAHTSVFNSLKLNPYQIGVRLFDDVVRKMLDAVAPAVASFPLDGYEIGVRTATGDASEKYADQKTLYYQFYLPKKMVQSYKNKDITGQQLISASVILLNDERIDLRLQ